MIHSRFWRPAPDLACGWLVFNEYNAGADHIEYENGKSTSAFPLYNVSPSLLLYLFLVFLFLLRSTLCFVSFTLLADLSDSVLATTSPRGGIPMGSALSNRVKEIRERRVQEERGGGWKWYRVRALGSVKITDSDTTNAALIVARRISGRPCCFPG